uniref:TRAF-type domain-containing protein n=1 Tax=Daphnia galeata TaxID=27404 RepID=A0A8J2WE98_9CRUS|nr:unnamed protein product [Daphnia galeata]
MYLPAPHRYYNFKSQNSLGCSLKGIFGFVSSSSSLQESGSGVEVDAHPPHSALYCVIGTLDVELMSVLSQFCLARWKSVDSMTPTALVYNLSSDSILTCSDDDETSNSMEFSKVYPESSSQKTIFSSVVYCIHRKEGCDWNGELRKLKAHLLSCTLDAIPCRMQCGQQVSRLAHDDHGRNFCPNRRQICDYCQVEFNGLQYDVSFSDA